MALYALDDLADAFRATKAFLLPFDAWRWLRLAFVALLVGGGASVPNAGGSVGDGFDVGPGPGPAPGPGFQPPDWIGAAVVVAVVLAVLLAIALAVLSAILEFAFVEALRTDEVALRRDVARHWGKGLRLFGFRVVVGLAVALPVLALFAVLFLGVAAVGVAGLLALVIVLPVVFVLGAVAGLVNGFTTVFVVPVMLLEDLGVVAAWSRFWETLSGAWTQFGAYAVVGVALNVGAGIAVGVGAAVAALLLAAPFGVVFLVPHLLAGTTATLVWLGVGAVLYGLAVLVVVGLVQVPVQSALRYYALFVLGDVDPDLDLVPERRTAVRAGDDTAA